MNNLPSMGLDDVLEQCLHLIERGGSIEDCIARFPSYADELYEILALAVDLNGISPPLMTRSQMQRMQYDVLERIDTPTSWWGRLVSRQFVLAAGAVAAMILIVAGLVFTLSRDDSSQDAVVAGVSETSQTEIVEDTVTAVAIAPTVTETLMPTETQIQPTPTIMPTTMAAPTLESPTIESTATEVLPTATVEQTTPNTPTLLPTEEPEDQSVLPVYIDYSGQVSEIDSENGQIEMDGVSVVLDDETLESVEVGEYVVVSGVLDDNGSVSADIVEETTLDAIEDDARTCEIDETGSDENCHPVLLILSDAFQVPYDRLASLHGEGFGIGEISRIYILAQETGTSVVEIIQLRRDGLSWEEMIALLRGLSPSELAQGIIIGNGRGQTIRPDLDGAKLYAGSSGQSNGTVPINPTTTSVPSTPIPPVINTVPPAANTVAPPTAEPPTSSPPEMVTICHNGNTVTVDWDSWVNAHSKHGDTLGACE